MGRNVFEDQGDEDSKSPFIETPVTEEGLVQYDNQNAMDAIIDAWVIQGVESLYHRRMQDQVRRLMPLLGRALDRAAEERFTSGK